jgi:hypothetical protein
VAAVEQGAERSPAAGQHHDAAFFHEPGLHGRPAHVRAGVLRSAPQRVRVDGARHVDRHRALHSVLREGPAAMRPHAATAPLLPLVLAPRGGTADSCLCKRMSV